MAFTKSDSCSKFAEDYYVKVIEPILNTQTHNEVLLLIGDDFAFKSKSHLQWGLNPHLAFSTFAKIEQLI